MHVHASNFKAYDIRGVVRQDSSTRPLPSTSAGRSAAKRWQLGEKAVAVGRDGRLSRPHGLAAKP